MPTTQTQALLDTIGTWWRNWKHARAAVAEVDGLEGAELSRVANDVGLNGPQLRTLAGKWPDAADLLSQRLAALQIDEATVARSEPGVLRDLQRVCSMCPEKPHCGHDIDRDPSDPEWRQYCPNVETLEALDAERAARRLDHPHRG
jgi:hypothetical protein